MTSFTLPVKPSPYHPASNLCLDKKIGSGAFSRVYSAFDLASKKRVAVKQIMPSNREALETVKNEIQIMRRLKDCPNVIQFEDAFLDEHQNVFLVMELGRCNLMDIILERNGAVTEAEARSVFVQVARAVFGLHSRDIVHRDIKLDNTYVMQSDSESNSLDAQKLVVKLGDFGLATTVTNFGAKLDTLCGTPQYAAPELVSGRPYNGKKVDIWALGVVLWRPVWYLHAVSLDRPSYEGQTKAVLGVEVDSLHFHPAR
jgi:serine/threonine protein kinase